MSPPTGKPPKRQSAHAIEARLRELDAEAIVLAQATRRLAGDEVRSAEARHRALVEEAGRLDPQSQQDAAMRAFESALSAALPGASRLADELAPGLAGLPADDPGWRSIEFVNVETAPFVRVGDVTTKRYRFPVVLPLLATNGWLVNAGNDPIVGHQMLQSMALRMVASAEPFRVRVDSYDPRLTGAMGLLGHLTTKHPQIVPRSVHTSRDLTALLAELVDVSSSRAGRLAQAGYRHFAELVADSSRVIEPYRLVLLFDYPNGVDAAAQAELVRLAASAADRGICFLVHHDETTELAYGVEPARLATLLDPIAVSAGTARAARLPNVVISVDPPFPATTAAVTCDLVAQQALKAVLPKIPFEETLPGPDEDWTPVHDELATVIGYEDRLPAVLRLRTGNPALPHVLIGGAAGQGKSNLLLVLIHGLAARYSPDDLEMYLLDFKFGIEFAALGPAEGRNQWLPHVRVLGVHSDKPFGLAVLRHLNEELARRSEIFKAGGKADLADFKPGPPRPPRLLVVLDEFQILMEDNDKQADEAVRLLEKLARQGRAYGLHLVLATQTIEGVSRLAGRKDSIFGQVPYRIALKTTPSDSQAILGIGNTAASTLQIRGEAIVNANLGLRESNQKVLVSFADKEVLAGLRQRLFERVDPVRPPRIFNLGESAQLSIGAGRPVARGGAAQAWVGLPIAVSERPVAIDVRPEPGAGVLVLGDGPLEAVGVLSSLVITAVASSPEPPEVILADVIPGDEAITESKAALEQVLRGLKCPVRIVEGPRAVASLLEELRARIQDQTSVESTFWVPIGMHALPLMKTRRAGGLAESPADDLQVVVGEGPTAGIVTFGWWNRLHVANQQLGTTRGNTAAHVFLRHPLDGVRSVCGPLTEWSSEPYRALVRTGIDPEPITVVPFAALREADVPKVLKRLAPR